MLYSAFKRIRGPLLGAAAAVLAVGATSALAGSGVGGIFNLGQANTVDGMTSLTGTVGGNPQLRVENAATGSNSFGVMGKITSPSAAGSTAGIRGVTAASGSTSYGIWGEHKGSGTGVYGLSNHGTGLRGESDAHGTGVYGFSAGDYVCAMAQCNRYGRGVFGESTTGYGIYGASSNGYAGYFDGRVRAETLEAGAQYGVDIAINATSDGINGTLWSHNTRSTGGGAAVRGTSYSGRGVWGQSLTPTRSGDQPGVYGWGFAEDGIWAISDQATGLYAQAPNYAAYLNGRTFVDGSLSLGWRPLGGGATPDVHDGSLYRVSNTSSTTITNFANGRSGQQLTLRFTNSNTSVADNSTIKLAGGFSPNVDDTLQLVNDGGVWYETGRSSN